LIVKNPLAAARSWRQVTVCIATQQHGGTITFDSEVGGFTEFTVRLPRRRRAVPSASPLDED